ncbi:uncharacterized protein AMSG_11812 [Thecamonas trahens ATCC 50062]|uniref:Uncharacterized protein n=1 Tax=Thecamonas trahens ATCC 50062 TaxID=461836 RepID=A0A0L0D967_THETB|nr:hypothetical protein AMSG_11812 [Thecamonas trahens ATCC 50062]KNC48889.1 hypothetical protein AMSG_11812 [Thecamonas trahens ATCC 50062]|eukprot:XP_013758448.1 hypothetical protein AMSG_11812 [Thecamonas trahens ATCC 50062]
MSDDELLLSDSDELELELGLGLELSDDDELELGLGDDDHDDGLGLGELELSDDDEVLDLGLSSGEGDEAKNPELDALLAESDEVDGSVGSSVQLSDGMSALVGGSDNSLNNLLAGDDDDALLRASSSDDDDGSDESDDDDGDGDGEPPVDVSSFDFDASEITVVTEDDYEAEAVTNAELGPEPVVEDEAEPVVEDEAEPVVEVEDEDEPVVEVEDEDEPVVEVEDEAEPVVEVEDEAEPAVEVEAEAEPVVEVESKAEPVVETEAEAAARAETAALTKTEAEHTTKTEAEHTTKAEAEFTTKAETEVATKAETSLESTTHPTPSAKATTPHAVILDDVLESQTQVRATEPDMEVESVSELVPSPRDRKPTASRRRAPRRDRPESSTTPRRRKRRKHRSHKQTPTGQPVHPSMLATPPPPAPYTPPKLRLDMTPAKSNRPAASPAHLLASLSKSAALASGVGASSRRGSGRKATGGSLGRRASDRTKRALARAKQRCRRDAQIEHMERRVAAQVYRSRQAELAARQAEEAERAAAALASASSPAVRWKPAARWNERRVPEAARARVGHPHLDPAYEDHVAMAAIRAQDYERQLKFQTAKAKLEAETSEYERAREERKRRAAAIDSWRNSKRRANGSRRGAGSARAAHGSLTDLAGARRSQEQSRDTGPGRGRGDAPVRDDVSNGSASSGGADSQADLISSRKQKRAAARLERLLSLRMTRDELKDRNILRIDRGANVAAAAAPSGLPSAGHSALIANTRRLLPALLERRPSIDLLRSRGVLQPEHSTVEFAKFQKMLAGIDKNKDASLEDLDALADSMQIGSGSDAGSDESGSPIHERSGVGLSGGLSIDFDPLAVVSPVDDYDQDATESIKPDARIWDVLDSEPPLYYNAKKRVAGGTVNRLVEFLTLSSGVSDLFTRVFFLTYKCFTTKVHLLAKLLGRYLYAPTDGSVDVRGVRARVIYVLRFWVEHFPFDFDRAPRLFSEIQAFASTTLVDDGFLQHSSQLLVALDRATYQIRTRKEEERRAKETLPTPDLLAKYRKRDICALDAVDVAKQLTLVSFSLFQRIRPSELIRVVWTKSATVARAPNVMRMIARFNELSAWVQLEILKREKPKDRAAVITKFVYIAHELVACNNFDSLMSIIAALNSAPILRLRHSQALIKSKVKARLAAVEDVMSSRLNHSKYRSILFGLPRTTPALPYLGMFLQDLFFIDDGNPDMYQDKPGVVNFTKHHQTASMIMQVQRFQAVPFTYDEVPWIRAIVTQASSLDDNGLYSLSLEREPRR